MVAGALDIGFMALPPFFIGADKGMEWKIMSGLSEVPVALVSLDEDIQSLSDFDESDRIALPQPGSIQHMLLSMAAEKEFGDAKRFDNRIVTMTHPDGMHALLANIDIAGHFTSPPYIFMELENPKAHIVLTGEEAIGERFTFAVGVSTDKFSMKNPLWESAFKDALAESISFIKKNSYEASQILSKSYGLDEEKIYEYITREDMLYTLEINGMKKFHDFMETEGYIDDLGEIDKLIRGGRQ
jgi:NitT/TauT family transport system substrate-binding protein